MTPMTLQHLTARPNFEREGSEMGVAMAIGFLASGVLGILVLALPANEGAQLWGTAATALAGLIVGAGVFAGRRAIPLWGYAVGVAAGIGLITAAVVFNASSNVEVFYLYVAGFVFYYFSEAEAAAFTVLSLGAYAIARSGSEPGIEPTALLALAGGMLMIGLMLRFLGGRARSLSAELERQATTDALTGLLNRRGLQRLADAELSQAIRTGRRFSLLIGDLDHFKSVNDRLGHMGGDMALERVAAGLAGEQRSMDSAARVGGEEFALLMPETDKENALFAAERFRRGIASAFRGRPVELTMSIGVATYPDDGESWEQLLDAADTALYAAKDRGRDQVVGFERDSSSAAT